MELNPIEHISPVVVFRDRWAENGARSGIEYGHRLDSIFGRLLVLINVPPVILPREMKEWDWEPPDDPKNESNDPEN